MSENTANVTERPFQPFEKNADTLIALDDLRDGWTPEDDEGRDPDDPFNGPDRMGRLCAHAIRAITPVVRHADVPDVFAQFNDGPHMLVDVPDGWSTVSCRTSDGKRVTFAFVPYERGGAPKCVDVQYHDSGLEPIDNGGRQVPTMDCIAFTVGRSVYDSRDTHKGLIELLRCAEADIKGLLDSLGTGADEHPGHTTLDELKATIRVLEAKEEKPTLLTVLL